MRRLAFTMLFVIGLVSSASAHHMAQYDDAGINIPDSSPHLLREFF